MKKTIRRIIFLGTALAIGCTEAGDLLLSPDEGPQHSKSQITEVAVLQRSTPLSNDISVSASIGKAGGSIEIPEAGIKVVFPMNALEPPAKQKTVTITVTALKGSDVAYRFEPHGLTFHTPVKIEQDAKLTAAYKDPAYTSSEGAYFPDDTYLSGGGTAKVTEFRQTDYDFNGSKFKWYVDHFSGYLLASSRL